MPQFPLRRDAESAEFFAAAAAGEFLLVRDSETGEFHGPQFDRTVDPQRYVSAPAAGTGRVVSWAVVHDRGSDGLTTRVVVGIVALDEGPWWWTELADADPDTDLDGARVEVAFERIGSGDEDEVQPFFRILG
ncbi:hypothetical protein GCM10025867_10970 [Frondihabitans sucicola]|uniref:ChsH2 C-terminal OB-fold domain-containing protein n=1 Tax=Frondihabitans sucicola TaxID=1268041 RepID=A0ABN6XYW6_9MICO|nr:OB-fold domain-containing protein [Frondihabitans sucicola]BDZ48856.1 hypothetical protein GCM10025867_10970 [Frondihabitans sucicola]